MTGTGKFTRRKGNISHNKTRMSKAARGAIDEMIVVSKPGQTVAAQADAVREALSASQNQTGTSRPESDACHA